MRMRFGILNNQIKNDQIKLNKIKGWDGWGEKMIKEIRNLMSRINYLKTKIISKYLIIFVSLLFKTYHYRCVFLMIKADLNRILFQGCNLRQKL